MTLDEFQSLVESNISWFAGVNPESIESLSAAEDALGVSFPATLKWLLTKHGYSSCCGVASLTGTVEETMRLRAVVRLPNRYVILDDRGDAGVVLLDSASQGGRVIWIADYAVRTLVDTEPDNDIDVFPEFAVWAIDCLETAKEEN